MERPRQHIIETESKKELNLLLPNDWVVRELGADYGLDFMIEIFQSGHSTGNIFYLQMKGSDQKIENDTISYQLKREHIEYFSSISSPVLFVMYSTASKQFWGIWSNALKEILVEQGDKQKTYKLTFDKRHLIDKNFFIQLEKTFSNALPKKANITFESTTDRGRFYHQQLLKWMQYYFGAFTEIENYALPATLQFLYHEDPADSLNIKIIAGKNEFTLAPINLREDNFIYLPALNIKHPAKELQESLVIIAYQLHRYDARKGLELLTISLPEYKGNLLPPVGLIEIIKKAIETNAILEIQTFSKVLIKYNRTDIFQIVNAAILLFNKDGHLTTLYRDNWHIAIANMDEKSIPAFVCYNLANSYRATHDLYLASKYYQLARKNDPKYLQKAYWWFEYGGALFLSNHYRFAEKFYRKSIELDKDDHVPLIYTLVGDALFFQGKFSQAKIEFDKFLSISSLFSGEETYLKSRICQNFILAKLDNIDFDIPRSMQLTQEASSEKSAAKLNEAILAYPLNAWAWFNYGVLLKDDGNEKDAFTAFLTAACIEDWDREAWKNCFFHAMNLRDKGVVVLIFGAILNKFGIEFVNYMAQNILNDPQLSKEAKIELVGAMGKLGGSPAKESQS